HKMNPGFSVGVITNLRLARYLDLRFIPTFSLGQRDLIYTYQRPADEAPVREKKLIESILVELPLDVKWKAKRIVNTRPYVLAGFKYTADLASLTKRKRETMEEEYEIKLRKHDVGFNLGVGWEFYLPFNNKIALELKMYFGLLDLLQREQNIYTDRIERLTSRMLQFNIMFE
ncbi:MAG: PorT family protein, partial [Bacteroidales bacterium]|nr:PorT family protein [Bacteroidales bacterium]